jgi:hypothetical protein
VEVFDFKMESIKSCMEALELHIQNQGGKIQSSAVFDPFKSSLASTADSMKIPIQKSGVVDSYDPSAVQSEIDKIQNERLVSILTPHLYFSYSENAQANFSYRQRHQSFQREYLFIHF